MRLPLLAVPVLALLTACGGGEPSPDDSLAAAPAGGPAAASASASSTPADSGAIPASTPQLPPPDGKPAPVVGAIIEVKMIGDAAGYRFEPAHVTAKPGDGIKFVVVSGGPHEVAFELEKIPQATKTQFLMNMPNGANGRSPLLAAPRETWTLSLTGLQPGLYPFYSTPRLPQGMKGELEIK
ncbi:MAG TPA: plastocyanin/azurin family copper-binding protein [Gemmatimonadaceae bacterium]|nr:plastocyanin/azurin family copper-binding protein [Gemmatimonadaceae bacterium]